MAKFIKVIEVYGKNLHYKREVWYNVDNIAMVKDLKKEQEEEYGGFEKISCIGFIDISRSSVKVLHTPEEIFKLMEE